MKYDLSKIIKELELLPEYDTVEKERNRIEKL